MSTKSIRVAGGARQGTGMVLGKFMPPHLGHVFLVDFAREYVKDLTVVVGTLKAEPIPGELRYEWMRELFPDVRVVHLTDENPQYPHEHPQFWDIWRDSLQRVLPVKPDYVFASEEYGAKLAEVLGAEFVPVDIARGAVPVSGTAIRNDPWTHWRYLPRCVRPYFARRVCVFGPESTGKSTLTKRLAEHFETVMVPEYARILLEHKGPDKMELADMTRIARGQVAAEDALVRGANRVIICDTDVLTTTIWSEVFFGECPEFIRQEAERRDYDLYLLTDVDVPWVADPVRYLPNERISFLERCENALRSRGRRYVKLSGSWDERFERAKEAVESLLEPGTST
ncbi:AAA family ATPase [Archangium violaceum]|uniref:AAA family ATPase n=1 Tax=Archangium violaceum TaxID=83451 RepID=UPI00194ECFEB|nr:AAA family ATPase [Archangium violaceum]QRN98817.1 AAA family ATPase [Archangium violaceum]